MFLYHQNLEKRMTTWRDGLWGNRLKNKKVGWEKAVKKTAYALGFGNICGTKWGKGVEGAELAQTAKSISYGENL